MIPHGLDIRRTVRPLLLTLLLTLLLLLLSSPAVLPLHAAVACVTTDVIATGDDLNFEVMLSGNSLVWSNQANTLFRYDLVTAITTPLGSLRAGDPYEWRNTVAVDQAHVVWIDPAGQVQLYTTTTGETVQLTTDSDLKIEPEVEGNYVTWRQGKPDSAYKFLYLHDLTTAAAVQLGKVKARTNGYNRYTLNEGRVLWNGNLYEIASGQLTYLGENSFAWLRGDIAVGVLSTGVSGNPGFTMFIKNLVSGAYTEFGTGPATSFKDLVLSEDHVVWLDNYRAEVQEVVIYQVSTGQFSQPPTSISYYPDFVAADGRFVGYTMRVPDAEYDKWYDDFAVYDLVSGSVTPMTLGGLTGKRNAITGDLDAGRIAWVEYREVKGKVFEMAVMLRTDCGASATIVEQSGDLSLVAGRSVTLSVTATGDEPITYQWYQGEQGDTTLPVGANSPTFVTPALTTTTAYWVRTTNYYGIEDSNTIHLTVGDSVNLMVNGDFETYLYSSVWESKNASHMEQKCNKPARPVAHSGECALRIRGRPAKQSLLQTIYPGPVLPGDTLTLSAWTKAVTDLYPGAKIVLRVTYADATSAKRVIKPNAPAAAYELRTADPLTLTGPITTIKVQIHSKVTDWWVDDLRLMHQGGTAGVVLPLPQPGRPDSRQP